jgi:hypothetical protein
MKKLECKRFSCLCALSQRHEAVWGNEGEYHTCLLFTVSGHIDTPAALSQWDDHGIHWIVSHVNTSAGPEKVVKKKILGPAGNRTSVVQLFQ